MDDDIDATEISIRRPAITRETIEAILEASADGLAPQDIAALVGVSVDSLQSWIARGEAEERRLTEVVAAIDRLVDLEDFAAARRMDARLATAPREAVYLLVARAFRRGRAQFARDILRGAKRSSAERDPGAALKMLGAISPAYAFASSSAPPHVLNFHAAGPTQVIVAGQDDPPDAMSSLSEGDLRDAAHSLARLAMQRRRPPEDE